MVLNRLRVVTAVVALVTVPPLSAAVAMAAVPPLQEVDWGQLLAWGGPAMIVLAFLGWFIVKHAWPDYVARRDRAEAREEAREEAGRLALVEERRANTAAFEELAQVFKEREKQNHEESQALVGVLGEVSRRLEEHGRQSEQRHGALMKALKELGDKR